MLMAAPMQGSLHMTVLWLLYSLVHFCITVLLLNFSHLADGVESNNSYVLSGCNATRKLVANKFPVDFFDDSLKEPNQWKIFKVWSCNNPVVGSTCAVAPYTKLKVGGGNASGIILFGGRLSEQDQYYQYATWFYDMYENLWYTVRMNNEPQNRRGHIMLTLCHTTVVMMGGWVKRKPDVYHPKDLWVISERLGKWKELLKDCRERSCHNSCPALPGSTVKTIHQPLSPCQCRESVLIFGDRQSMSTVWELRCVKDEDSYIWLKFSTDDTEKHGFKVQGNLTASSVKQSVVYTVAGNGVWQYFHNTTHWSSLKANMVNSVNKSNSWYPTKQDLNLVDCTLFSDYNQQLILFGRFLTHVIVFSPLIQHWKSESVVGTPPIVLKTIYHALMVDSTILIYAGTNGRCKQLVWTLKRSSEADAWYWTQISTPGIEPQDVVRATAHLGNHLYISGFIPRPNPNSAIQLWDLDLTSMQWWQLRVSGPPAMDGMLMIATNDQSAIVVAGKPKQQPFNTWMFSSASKKWMKLYPVAELNYRKLYSVANIRNMGILLFGGFDRHCGKERRVVNDVWLFHLNGSDPQSSQWEPVVVNKQQGHDATENDHFIPSPRYYHSAAVINNSMFVFGGQDQSGDCLHDLWSLHLETYSWSLVTNNSEGPRPALSKDCFSSAAATGPHLVVTTGCSPSFTLSHHAQCDSNYLQQTWLYLPHLNKWSFVAWIQDLHTHSVTVTFPFRDYIVIPDVRGKGVGASPQLHYLFPQCPDGLASPDIKKLPCQPCPVGKFSATNRKWCDNCPIGLTTPTEASSTIFNCTVCKSSVCVHGKCLVLQVDGRPSPVCQCTPGFTGTNCSVPTYYVIALSILIVAILVVCGTWAFFHQRKQKLQREIELSHQVRELTSAWQVNYSELTIHNRIGAGGFGEVYNAQYRDLTVAVKVLHPLSDKAANLEFEREIKFMQTIRHPNIVLFIGARKKDEMDKSPFLITEYVHRGSLRGILDQLDIELSSKQRIKFATDAAHGMNFLHTQEPARIHRDLKSDNLLVSTDWVVKVADFGLGRQVPWCLSTQMERQCSSLSVPLLLGDQMEMTCRGIGAARWRAPEIVVGTSSYGTGVDVYRY